MSHPQQEMSTAERRADAVFTLIKKGQLSRAALTLIPREQFHPISNHYGLDLEIPVEARKYEADELLWKALLDAEIVRETDEEGDRFAEAQEFRGSDTNLSVSSLSDVETGARPKASPPLFTTAGMGSDSKFSNISTFAGTSTVVSTSVPLFTTAGMGMHFSPSPNFSGGFDKSSGLLSTSSMLTTAAPTFGQLG